MFEDNIKLENDIEKAMRLKNNTSEILYKNGIRAIRLHQTDVVTFHPNGYVTFNTGGWRTATTKVRINEYAPDTFTVRQVKGEWYFMRGDNVIARMNGNTLTFNPKTGRVVENS